MLVDVHCHLDSDGFKESVEKMVANAARAGVTAIINCGINIETNRATKVLADTYHIVKAAYGIYPTEAEDMTIKQIEKEIEWIKTKNPIAISEIGLDGKYGKDFKKQKEVFSMFIKLAKKLDVPVVVHTRQKEKEVISLLKKHNAPKVVLHCFTGDLELVKEAIKLKYHFSIPPILVFNEGFQEMVKLVPNNLLLTETDSPYLAPKRGAINNPANVQVTVNKIAELKGLDPIEVKRIIFMNYQRLFL